MKLVLKTLVAGLLVASCGSENARASGASDMLVDRDFQHVRSVSGEVEGVVLQLGSTVDGTPFTRTGVLLHFKLACMSKLAPLSYRVETKSKKAKIYVSAFEKLTKRSLTAFCSEGYGAKEMITLDGMFSEENIEVIFLEGGDAQLPKKLSRLTPVGMSQIQFQEINDRLRVSVGTSGCLDGVSLAHKITQNKKGDLKIVLGALVLGNKESERVRCFVQNFVTFEIDLPQDRPEDSKINVVVADNK